MRGEQNPLYGIEDSSGEPLDEGLTLENKCKPLKACNATRRGKEEAQGMAKRTKVGEGDSARRLLHYFQPFAPFRVPLFSEAIESYLQKDPEHHQDRSIIFASSLHRFFLLNLPSNTQADSSPRNPTIVNNTRSSRTTIARPYELPTRPSCHSYPSPNVVLHQRTAV